MIGRVLTNPLGAKFAVIDFNVCSDHDHLYAQIVPVRDGLPAGPPREIESIAGWLVGNHICTCWADELA